MIYLKPVTKFFFPGIKKSAQNSEPDIDLQVILWGKPKKADLIARQLITFTFN